MKPMLLLILTVLAGASMAAELTVDVNVMPRIVFVGDSQTCGCVGALDYAQMMSWEIPLRVFNRAVGGSNTSHLIEEFGRGTVSVKKGEKLVIGEGTGWYAGPYIGMTLRLGTQEYTLDHIETTDYTKANCNAVLTEPAREDFSGTDFKFEAGWRVRIAEVKPQIACFMYSVNDAGRTSEDYRGKLAEITRRCRESGIQPIFLSGVPMMDPAGGGSHPSGVARTLPRVQDMQDHCAAEKLPFGDVFRTLELLDAHHTAVWADTIHPTDDGSAVAVWALRYLLGKLGALDNPYYVRGYRAPEQALPDPRQAGLQPITTSQPRRDRNNKLSESGFDLESRRVRDEYGLIAEADGHTLQSDRPLVLQFGIGDPARLQSARLELVTVGNVKVSLFDYRQGKWQALGAAEGRSGFDLSAPQLQAACQEGAVRVGLEAATVALDYAALRLTGEVQPFALPRVEEAVMWPPPGLYEWPVSGNLLANGDFAAAQAGGPQGWKPSGNQAYYISNGLVAKGNGDFAGEKQFNQFRCAGAQFTKTVRPLDMVQIDAGPEGCTGNFLVARVVDDEHLALRRAAKTMAAGLDFRVIRYSGCRAVTGDCAVGAVGDDGWTATTASLATGKYRLGYFSRVYDPSAMAAAGRPGPQSRVSVQTEGGKLLAERAAQDDTYLWQRSELIFEVARAGKVAVGLGAAPGRTVEYTGLSLQRQD